MSPETPATEIAPPAPGELRRADALAERLHRLVADHPDFEVLDEPGPSSYRCRFVPNALAERRGEPAVEALIDRLNRRIAERSSAAAPRW